MKTSIEDISYDELCAIEPEWNALIIDSDPAALTASPMWVKTWWSVFKSTLADPEWRAIAVRDPAGRLIGLALFFVHRVNLRGLGLRRLELVGQQWRSPLVPRSEYGGFISNPRDAESVTKAVFNRVAQWKDWDEMILGNTLQDMPGSTARQQCADEMGWYCRRQESGTTYAMEISDGFDEYLKTLPGKFRQRVFNHRQKLANQGRLVSRSAAVDETNGFLEILNGFHERRWGKPVFEDRRLEFHRRLTRELSQAGRLYLNVMEVNDQPVSLLYDIIAGSTKYGFQLGFDSAFDTKVSLFSVHLGFSIEDAFSRGLQRFDMLRGHGRSGRDYKERVATPFRTTATEQYLRSRGVRIAARLYDGVRSLAGGRKE